MASRVQGFEASARSWSEAKLRRVRNPALRPPLAGWCHVEEALPNLQTAGPVFRFFEVAEHSKPPVVEDIHGGLMLWACQASVYG